MIAVRTTRAQVLQAQMKPYFQMLLEVFANGVDAQDYEHMKSAWQQRIAENQKQTRWFLKWV